MLEIGADCEEDRVDDDDDEDDLVRDVMGLVLVPEMRLSLDRVVSAVLTVVLSASDSISLVGLVLSVVEVRSSSPRSVVRDLVVDVVRSSSPPNPTIVSSASSSAFLLVVTCLVVSSIGSIFIIQDADIRTRTDRSSP